MLDALKHYAGIMHRSKNIIDLIIRDRPGVKAYRLWLSRSIDDVYGNPTGSNVSGDELSRHMIVEVKAGTVYISKKLSHLGGVWDTRNKGQTRVIFSYADFWTAADPHKSIPSDDDYGYLRIQPILNSTNAALTVVGAIDTGDPILGSVLVIPNTTFFSTQSPILALSGKAPCGQAFAANEVPQQKQNPDLQNGAPLCIVFPRPTSTMVITNTGTKEMLYSLGWGQPMSVLASGYNVQVQAGTVKEVIVASSGDLTTYSILATIPSST